MTSPPTYQAEIARTTHGVAHITAESWGDLGFGQGYACAADHLPAIADHVTKVRSERARYLGAGPGDRHLHTDLGYLALGVRRRAEHMLDTQPAHVVEAVTGYAAGVSRWLAEHGTDGLPPWCAGAPWIRPIDALDLFTVYADIALMASGRNLVEYIGSAFPPGTMDHDEPPPPPPEPLTPDPGLASNGWAFGGARTANGRGLVVANPHFPWWGEGRFWECHLRIPGLLDVYGGSLIGCPLVQIGFNTNVAWTHTFSRGQRFAVYRLDLDPADPTRYRYGDDERAMAPTTHTVEVLDEHGVLVPVTRTLWHTHYGPMLNLPLVGWSTQMGFTYRDANADNDRFLTQVAALNTATGMDDFQAAMAEHQGLPWVNTLAADDTGRCWYIDVSTTPKLSDAAQASFEQALTDDVFTAMLYDMRVVLLDGSDPTFEWVDDPDAPSAGVTPYAELPQLERDDYVFNSNDPYWLPHVEAQLPRHQTMCGLFRRPVTPRTRMNARICAEGRDWTVASAVGALLDNRSLLADLLCDDIIERLRRHEQACAPGPPSVEADAELVNLTGLADLLASWDRRFDLDSVGAVAFRELLASFTAAELADAGILFARGFDPDDPVGTPCELAPPPEGAADPVLVAAGRALRALEAAGISPDAPLGTVQYAERGGRRFPIHGGFETEGIANVIAPIGTLTRADTEPGPEQPPGIPGRTERTGLHVGGYPAVYGVSFIMAVAFGDDGPEAQGLLVYGQSGDARSPHHTDQLEPFAAKQLRPLLFTQEAIEADPNLVRTVVDSGGAETAR